MLVSVKNRTTVSETILLACSKERMKPARQLVFVKMAKMLHFACFGHRSYYKLAVQNDDFNTIVNSH
jgi:hypothetical protein